MPGFKPAEGAPLANAAKRHRIALRDKAKAERELEHQRRLEQIAEETAKAEIAKARKPREQAPNAERAWPQERPAPKPSPVLAPVVLPAATGIIAGRGVNFYSPIGEREPAWSRHHDSASSKRRPVRLNYSGYGTRRRP
jgi:hypothetical protein